MTWAARPGVSKKVAPPPPRHRRKAGRQAAWAGKSGDDPRPFPPPSSTMLRKESQRSALTMCAQVRRSRVLMLAIPGLILFATWAMLHDSRDLVVDPDKAESVDTSGLRGASAKAAAVDASAAAGEASPQAATASKDGTVAAEPTEKAPPPNPSLVWKALETVGLVEMFWPMTLEKLPHLAVVVLAVWATLFAALRRKATDADQQHDQRRARNMLDGVAQVCHEHAGNEKKRAKYDKRAQKLRDVAEQRAAKAQRPFADVFAELSIETNFASVEPPGRLTAARVLAALSDEAGERIDLVPGLAEHLGRAQHDEFRRFFVDAHAILLTRAAATLEEAAANATREWRGSGNGISGGGGKVTPKDKAELIEALDVAKKVQELFFDRSLVGLLPPKAIEPPPDELTRAYTAPFESASLQRDHSDDANGAPPDAKKKKDEDKSPKKPPRTSAMGPHEEMTIDLRLFGGTTTTKVTTFASSFASAKVTLKQIKARDASRLSKLLATLSTQTLAWLALRFVCETGYAVFGPLNTLYKAQIAEDASLENWREKVFASILVLFCMFVVQSYLTDFVRIVSEMRSRQEFQYRLRNQLFEAVMRQDKASLDKHGYSELMRTLDSDARDVVNQLLFLPLRIYANVAGLCGQGALMYYKCPGMLWRSMIFSFAGLPIIIGMQRAVRYLHRRNDRVLRGARQRVNEMLRNLATVRMFARENQEIVVFDRNERQQANMDIVQRLIGHMQWPVIGGIMVFGEYANLWHGAQLVHEGTLNAAELVMLAGQSGGIMWRVKNAIEIVPQLGEVLLPADRVFTLLETESVIEPMAGERRAPFVARDGGVEIVFENVDFAYPTMLEHKVLRGVNLRIPAGKTVAFVGERGCGKSTTLELLQRSYDPINGRVLVNGEEMAHWDVRSYRRKLSVVSQQVSLFTGTIKENLLYGLDDAERLARCFDGPDALTKGDAALRKLCETACCWDFVAEFPLRLETRIGENGVKLSGGQTQCVAIARALLKQPAMLLLDEATSALDGVNQKLVADNIAAEQKTLGFSMVQIAHRLETLLTSDVVYYYVQGRIVEEAHTDDGSACDALRKVRIEYASVENAETGKTEQKLRKGHFHHLWNVNHDVQELDKLDRAKLCDKIEELEGELRAHAEELAHKNRMASFKLKLRSVVHLMSDHEHFDDAPFEPADAAARIKQARAERLRKSLVADDMMPPDMPALVRAQTTTAVSPRFHNTETGFGH